MNLTKEIEIKTLKKLSNRFQSIYEKYSWIDYFVAPIIVSIILLTIYAIKGVYPFGLNTVAYYDMPTNEVTGYTWVWDVLHGESGAYLNWNEGLGISLASSGNVFFPLNLFFLFVKRDSIIYTMSIFVLLKLAASAFTMSFYVKKNYESSIIIVCSGILYSFSGYVLQYYTNINFLDFVLIFPLIVYALELLLIKHKSIFFVLLMFCMFLCNVQLIWMLCIYICFKTFIVLNHIPKDERGKSVRILFISLTVSAMMACFVIIPEVMQLMNSSRVKEEGGGFDYFNTMKQVYCHFRRQKHLIMYGSEIAVGVLIVLIFRGRDAVKRYYDNLVMIIILALPILHEGINIIWHLGSYKHFPVRFGYMLTFECLIFVADYVSHERYEYPLWIGKITKILGVAALPFTAYILFKFFEQFSYEGIGDLGPYISYNIYFITLSLMFFLIFLMGTEIARRYSLITLAIIQAFCGAYGFIAPREAWQDNYRIKYIINEIDLKNELDGFVNMSERIKADPLMCESNYTYISKCSAISYWSYGVLYEFEKLARKGLGYDGDDSYLMDTGGTVFSDALIGVKYVAAFENPDDELYETIEGKKHVFKSKYTLPFGVYAYNEPSLKNNNSAFDYQNMLFRSLSGIDKDLIDISEAGKYVNKYTSLTDDEVTSIRDFFENNAPKERKYNKNHEYGKDSVDSETENKIGEGEVEQSDASDDKTTIYKTQLSIPIKGEKILYLLVPEDYDDTLSFILNGEPMYFSSFLTYSSNAYPNNLRNGILTLGSYCDEEFSIDIYSADHTLKDVSIGLLDRDILNEGIEKISSEISLNADCKKNGLSLSGHIKQNGKLLLPVAYSKNWHARVNGNKAKIVPFLDGALVALDVTKGDIDIELKYIPRGLITGICISVFGLIILLIFLIFEKRQILKDQKHEIIINKIFLYGYYTVALVIFVVMYLVPLYIKLAL